MKYRPVFLKKDIPKAFTIKKFRGFLLKIYRELKLYSRQCGQYNATLHKYFARNARNDESAPAGLVVKKPL